MITISVETDEEQWAIGTALVNGAIGFGNWPFAVKRRSPGGPGGSGGVTISGGSGVIGASVPDYWITPLRICCATALAGSHLGGCDEGGS